MFHAPKNVYGPNLFKIFADELGGPARVAKLLNVTEQTVKRWMLAATVAPKDAAKVPRAAVLALYWETQYGRSAMLAEHVNEIRDLYRQNQDLQAQLNRAKTSWPGCGACTPARQTRPILMSWQILAGAPPTGMAIQRPSFQTRRPGPNQASWPPSPERKQEHHRGIRPLPHLR